MASKDAKHLDPLEAYRRALTCAFCQHKMRDAIKCIPDCGKFICGLCYEELQDGLDELREFKCRACEKYHQLPESELADCTQMIDLMHHPIEKPVPPQAKRLRLLVDKIQEELRMLNAFDSKEYIDHQCDQLELEVRDAALSAINHIQAIEKDLLAKIKGYLNNA